MQLSISFTGAPRTARIDRSTELGVGKSKVSSMFAGTQDKCVACSKTVYPIEKVLTTATRNRNPQSSPIRSNIVDDFYVITGSSRWELVS